MIKRLHFLLLFIIQSSILLSQTFYVSTTQGSNENDGLTKRTPKYDLTDIPKNNVKIRLKSGDIFWGGIKGYENCIIESYGKGPRPVICGFKVLKYPNAWKKVGEKLWVLDLSETDNFTGNIFDENDVSFNNIGFIYDSESDRIYGRNLKEVDSLRHEMDFYTSKYFTNPDVKAHPFETVIVKSAQPPAILGHLCFPMAQHGMNLMTNCHIRGIAIVGFSKMGMVHLQGCKVEDCQIDMIGGGIMVGNKKRSRYGNGIELWFDFNDNVITDCIISRTYDCATTIQANGKINCNPRNNHFVGNRIYKCRQAFEHFMNPDDGRLIKYENCEFSGNICYLMGDNEFNCPEVRDCNILCYEEKDKFITVKNNVFFGANYSDGGSCADGLENNIVYIYPDQYLYTKHWGNKKNTVLSNEVNSIERYRKMTKDNSKIIILNRNSRRAKRIDRKIKRQVNWKTVELHLERIL